MLIPWRAPLENFRVGRNAFCRYFFTPYPRR